MATDRPRTVGELRQSGYREESVKDEMRRNLVRKLQSGEPLFPVEERPVPASDLPGEEAWPTQPVPLRPAPFVRQGITEADLTDISPEAHAYVLERFRRLRISATHVRGASQRDYGTQPVRWGDRDADCSAEECTGDAARYPAGAEG